MRLDIYIPLPVSRTTIKADMVMHARGELKSLDTARLKQATEEFEILLIEQMIKEMRNNVPESPIFGENRGREIFNDMLDSEYARIMENRGGFGLAKFMRQRMDGGNPNSGPAADSSFLLKTRYGY